MKRYIGKLYALFLDLIKEFCCKVQTCRRCRRRAVIFGIDSLIAVLILQLMRNLWRERHFSKAVQNLFENPLVSKAYQSVPFLHDIYDLCP